MNRFLKLALFFLTILANGAEHRAFSVPVSAPVLPGTVPTYGTNGEATVATPGPTGITEHELWRSDRLWRGVHRNRSGLYSRRLQLHDQRTAILHRIPEHRYSSSSRPVEP